MIIKVRFLEMLELSKSSRDFSKPATMIWITLLHELRQQVHSSAMPIFAVGFLMFLNAGVFFIGTFLNSNLAISVFISFELLRKLKSFF